MHPRSRIGVVSLLSAAVFLLLLQIWLLRKLEHVPAISQTRSLNQFPSTAGRWRSLGDAPLSPQLLESLDADELLSRNYQDERTGLTSTLLIAYYRTQLRVNQQYDFEEYLPDDGWSPLSSVTVHLPERYSSTVSIRYDLVVRGQERRLILRWFQTKERVLANGQDLHFYRVLNALANRPTGLATVQIVTPVLADQPKQVVESPFDFAQQVVNLTRATLFSR